MESYVRNSVVMARDDLPVFVDEGDGTYRARLDGYIIVPKEMVPDLDKFLDSLRVVSTKSAAAI